MTHRPGTGSNPPGALPNFLPLFATFCALLRHHAGPRAWRWIDIVDIGVARLCGTRLTSAHTAASVAGSSLGLLPGRLHPFCGPVPAVGHPPPRRQQASAERAAAPRAGCCAAMLLMPGATD